MTNFKSKLDTARDLLTFYNNAQGMIETIRKQYQNKVNRNINVPRGDLLYGPVRRWTYEQTDAKGSVLETTGKWKTNLLPAEGTTHNVELDGHKVKIVINTPKMQPMGGADSDPFDLYDDDPPPSEAGGINFSVKSAAAHQSVLNLLERLAEAEHAKAYPLKKFMTSPHGYFESRELIRRDLDTVHLVGDTKQELISDIENFENSEERYSTLGIPYHRGYLFYGLPGTGKSSVVKALSSYFNRHLYTMSLDSIKNDYALISLVTAIMPGSILLIEDIDVAKTSLTREGSGSGVTLSGLLNCFDGVHSPHNCIIIITTNDKAALSDPALLRAGRIDREFFFGEITQEQFERMFHYFYGFVPDYFIGDGHVPSEVVEIFKRNLHDGHTAIEDLKNDERF